MPKINISEALLEKDERDGDLCRTCYSPAEEPYEPYCMHCGLYWEDVENGLYDDPCGDLE